MAKANFNLPNGTIVSIEGSADDVERLVAFYSDRSAARPISKTKGPVPDASAALSPSMPSTDSDVQIDLMEIVNLIRTCDESERIESTILDRASVLHRVLLPMFIVHAHKRNAFGLTSGEINKITTELGVPVSQPNVSTCLSGPARIYIIGDKMRVKGHAVRYKLNRRGIQYVEQILNPSTT